MVDHEICDDSNINDSWGCLADCSGVVAGWNCSTQFGNGTTNCFEICDDGLIVGNEKCDDNIVSATKGCKSNCLEPYFGW